jgi:hypothetical protein
MSSSESHRDQPEAPERLYELRSLLVDLHKTLINSERITYAQFFGAVGSPGAFLHLITHDPWFAWLRPLSAFITTIDEALDGDDPVTAADLQRYIREMRTVTFRNGRGIRTSLF